MSEGTNRYFNQVQNVDSIPFEGIFDRQLSSITPIALCQTVVKAEHIVTALNARDDYETMKTEMEDDMDDRMNTGQALKVIFETGESNE